MIRYARQWLAMRRLNRLVQASRGSFATQDYAKRRSAALKATRP